MALKAQQRFVDTQAQHSAGQHQQREREGEHSAARGLSNSKVVDKVQSAPSKGSFKFRPYD